MMPGDQRTAGRFSTCCTASPNPPPQPKPVRIHLLFHATPAAILGNARVTGLHLERNRSVAGRVQPAGGSFDLQVGVVVTAIGYRSAPIRGLPFDDARGVVKNVAGRVDGWRVRHRLVPARCARRHSRQSQRCDVGRGVDRRRPRCRWRNVPETRPWPCWTPCSRHGAWSAWITPAGSESMRRSRHEPDLAGRGRN
ncbi:MAG: hypothetical protein MZW92_52705 [Comamonadaceae bacterium]|nr:hypothetical protein [Comamonadaceae bacterium]